MDRRLTLPATLAAWGGEDFAGVLCAELEALDPARLALEREMRHGSQVIGRPRFMLLGTDADAQRLEVRIGVFFESRLGGCACADDPTPESTYNEYAELRLEIDRGDATATVTPT